MNKDLGSYEIGEVTEKSIEIIVSFDKPSMISTDQSSPDVLEVKFVLPDVIVDAETNEKLELEETELIFYLTLGFQYSEDELAELVTL